MILNVLTTTIIYIITIASFLMWVFCSEQTHAPRRRKTVLHIVLRTVPFCLVFFFLCYAGNLNPPKAAIILAIVILASLFDPFLIVLLFLCIAEWIIGFPSKEDLFVNGSIHSQKEQSALDQSLVGTVAVTATALRPSGRIIVSVNEYEAKSEFDYIDQGRKVIITGKKDFAFIVKEEAQGVQENGK